MERAPPPLDEEPEHARRLFELTPAFGLSIPNCAHTPGCAALSPGANVGLTVLYRPVPSFAFGVSGRLDAFSIGHDTEQAFDASATWFGLAGRVYAFESGALDPYLELALGGGTLELSGSHAGGRDRARVDFTFGARLAAGLDVALTPWLRLGPELAFTEYVRKDSCRGVLCGTYGAGRALLPTGATSLGFRLTLATGERL